MNHVHQWVPYRLGTEICMNDEVIDGKRRYCTAIRKPYSSGNGGRALTNEELEALDNQIHPKDD